MRKIIVLLPISVLLLMLSCKKESEAPDTRLFDQYFPLSVGQYAIYDCDSIVYDEFTGTVDTFRFKIKEKLESTFMDNAGRTAYRMERWKQEEGMPAWFINDVWTTVKDQTQAERLEEDVRIISMVFPVRNMRSWNMHALNAFPRRDLRYEAAHQPMSINGLNFDSTVVVRSTDPENLVNIFKHITTFATGAGMIHHEFIDVRLFTINVTLPWQERIRSGVIYRMRLLEYGVE